MSNELSVYQNRAVASDWTPSETPQDGDLQLVHIPQIGARSFLVPVPNPAIAGMLSLAMSRYDLHLEDEGLRNNVMNSGGLNQFDGSDWYDWIGEEGEDFDNDVFNLEMKYQSEMADEPTPGTFQLTFDTEGELNPFEFYARDANEALVCQAVMTAYANWLPGFKMTSRLERFDETEDDFVRVTKQDLAFDEHVNRYHQTTY